MTITDVIREELRKAKEKHPVFPFRTAPAIILEELGEVAKEFNDYEESAGELDFSSYRQRAFLESAHVAVTAIRLMETLSGMPFEEEKQEE